MKALYPGTFDPVTHGHLDIIYRGTQLFDTLYIGVAVNARKNPIFTVEERVAYLNFIIDSKNVEVVEYEGLTVNYCRNKEIDVILRGVRNQLDFEYEYPIACANKELANEIETMFIMSDPSLAYISSSMVKEIVRAKGDISAFVPLSLVDILEEKLLYE